MTDVYLQLARFVDSLPAGFPSTSSGVELRILRMLFTPEEASLFMHLSMRPKTAQHVSRGAGIPIEEVVHRLEEMEKKGLVFAIHKLGRESVYMAQQFVIGFWEGQVNRLNTNLVEAFEEYLPNLIDHDVWREAPQLRTIPVGKSIPVSADVMTYELAEEIVRSQTDIAVANCICRQEMHILGKNCSKPIETCLSFGLGALQFAHVGRGRLISIEEALDIVEISEEAGLVLQPSNSQDSFAMCACCGCCCGVLRSLKLHPRPTEIASSPYVAVHDAEICSGCGDCVERCQMEALTLPNGTAELDRDRCIGCGLCVTTCSTGALSLERKQETELKPVPENTFSYYQQLVRARGM